MRSDATSGQKLPGATNPALPGKSEVPSGAPPLSAGNPGLAADNHAGDSTWRQQYLTDKQRIAAMIAAVAAAKAKSSYQPPSISRPVFTGGAPALEHDQMSQAVIDSDPILKFLYSDPVQKHAPWLLDGYQFMTRVTGPVGTFLNLGYNIWDTKKVFSDPKSPIYAKAGLATSTGLAAVSAGAATRLSLAAFHVWPMANSAMATLGRVAGFAGIGAGTILAGIDTLDTFRNPKATAAQKGFSTLSTLASASLAGCVLLGVGGPITLGLGIGTIACMLLKGWLSHNKVANEVFGTIGHGIGDAAHAIGHLFSGW